MCEASNTDAIAGKAPGGVRADASTRKRTLAYVRKGAENSHRARSGFQPRSSANARTSAEPGNTVCSMTALDTRR